MALPNVTGAIIATGYNCQVRIGSNPSDAKPIALVASFQANEDFQAQEATCLGNLGPISIDPQNYNCTITVDGFLPSKKVLNGEKIHEGAEGLSLMDYIYKCNGSSPLRDQYMEAGAIPKIAYLDFYNRKDAKVLASFSGVLITSDGINADANGYVRSNVQMRALMKN